MTLADLHRLLEERDARLSATVRALEALERAAAMVPVPAESEWAQALVTAQTEARIALEQEGLRDTGPRDGEAAREWLCAREAWCTRPSGHTGACPRPARAAVVEDFGPDAAKRRRY